MSATSQDGGAAHLAGHRPDLDGLRFFAFLGVFFYHEFRDRFTFGAQGVYVFFALSGFLITRILLRTHGQPGALRTFYARRVLRIFPLYYLVMVVLLALHQLQRPVLDFLYLQNVETFLSGRWNISYSHLWTLCVEEQYYLFFPPLVLLSRVRTIPASFLLLIFGSISWQLWSDSALARNPLAFVLAPYVGHYLLWGSLAGWIDTCRRDWARWAPAALLGAPILWALTLAAIRMGIPINGPLGRSLGAIEYSLLVYGIWNWPRGPLSYFLSFRPFAYLGRISYGLYVYHLPMITLTVLWRFHLSLGRPLSIAAAFVMTVAVAAFSWRFFEAPINGLKRRFPYREDAAVE